MTVQELIDNLREFPPYGILTAKPFGRDGKIIVIVEGCELDPLFQISKLADKAEEVR